jgi:hypothetical protein
LLTFQREVDEHLDRVNVTTKIHERLRTL